MCLLGLLQLTLNHQQSQRRLTTSMEVQTRPMNALEGLAVQGSPDGY